MVTDSSPRLTTILRSLSPSRRFPVETIRSWFWRPQVAVIDFRTKFGVRFAAEIHETGQSLELRFVARDRESQYALQRAVKRLSLPRAVNYSKMPISLAHWPNTTTNDTVTGDSLVNIQRILTILNAEELNVSDDSVPCFWWDMRTNFGDIIGPRIISALSGRPVHNTYGQPNAGRAIVSVGSILDVVRRNDMTVWGTGLMNPLTPSRSREIRQTSWNITAVRGYRTKAQLESCLQCTLPNVVGDPGLLFPEVIGRAAVQQQNDVAVIPHYAHKATLNKQFVESQDCRFIDVEQAPETVAVEIQHSRSVISTSLHGLILAQAYEVPWIWLKVEDQHLAGRDFKFEDFFSTVEAAQVSIETVQSADLPGLDIRALARRARLPEKRYSSSELLNAFPCDDLP